VAELKKDKKIAPVTAQAVKAFLADAEKGKAEARNVTARIRVITRESQKNLCFETCDRDGKDSVIHRSYVGK
jgi:hypothetical protein